MGAKVIIFCKFLISKFLKGLTHSAMKNWYGFEIQWFTPWKKKFDWNCLAWTGHPHTHMHCQTLERKGRLSENTKFKNDTDWCHTSEFKLDIELGLSLWLWIPLHCDWPSASLLCCLLMYWNYGLNWFSAFWCHLWNWNWVLDWPRA